ncbi:hypothetical protein ACSFCW_07565, partial [Yokenella regensburgei]|uniref:hypothetical protein n=1 Tax=Yokenella regensburgei TaxID=158877 RepID=UPI003ED8FF61
LYACRESYFSAYLTLWFPLLIWWTPLCRMLQIMTRRFTLYAYDSFALSLFSTSRSKHHGAGYLPLPQGYAFCHQAEAYGLR